MNIESEKAKKQSKEKAVCSCIDVIKLPVSKVTQQCTTAKIVEKQELETYNVESYEGPTWNDMEPGLKFSESLMTLRC